MLRKRPAFTLIAALSLALGIGVNTARIMLNTSRDFGAEENGVPAGARNV